MRLSPSMGPGQSPGHEPGLTLGALSAALFLLVAGTACTPDYYRKSADTAAGRILAFKALQVENVDPAFDIEPAQAISLEELERYATADDYLGEAARFEMGASIVDLAESLDLAIHHNRGYLTRKETIYLQALELTLIRHELEPIFTAGGEARRSEVSAETADGVEAAVDQLVSENTFATSTNLGFSILHKTGARLAADLTTDFLRFVGGDRSTNRSQLLVTLSQPLLKGGGTLTTLENLTQAERELLYEVRSFANFRREFVVGIATRYYNTLQARDRVRNTWLGYQGFRLSVEREEALAEEDRRTQTELGQLRQALLQSEGEWVDAVSSYLQQLDELKIELGVPVETALILDDDDLADLTIIDPKVTRDQAVDVALATRPDLSTAVDRFADAARKIEVAKQDLKAVLDVEAEYSLNGPATDGFPTLSLDRRNWSAGLVLDLPLDRVAERNAFRSALIGLEKSGRDRDLAYDEVRLQINTDWRALAQAKRNFEIAELEVDLSERRLEEQKLLAELGQGEARDLVDAQNDLVNSQNRRTAARVEHTLARLRLWQDMGILFINSDGSWVRKLETEGQAQDD